MDELDKLKKILDSAIEEKIQQPVDHQLIERIIRSKSADPIARLKKNLREEIWMGIALIFFLVVLMFILTEPYFRIKIWGLIAIMLAGIGDIYATMQKMSKIWHKNQESIKQSIISTLKLFRFFRKYGIILSTILGVVFLYFGFILGYGVGSDGQRITSMPFAEFLPFHIALIINLLLFGLICGSLWIFAKKHITKLYYSPIQKLEEILNELLENENN